MEKLQEVLKQHDVAPEELLEWLGSESVHKLLRYGTKSPSSSGMDDCEDSDYYDLYDLVSKIRVFNK